jgi:aminoglycoside phosphotransferase (APT) family kinase protein
MEPGRLIATGRDADILEYGPGLVLRRTRDGRSLEHEARIMSYAADQGYPVPVIHELRAGGSELVMDHVAGPLMSDAILRRLWTLGRAAQTLADLHDRLHAIPAPAWMRQTPDGGTRFVHLDLHPLNVIMHPERGPVVIDWANGARGEPLTDVAMTYVLLTCPDMPGPRALQVAAGPVRQLLARRFVRRWRGPALDARVADVADQKARDRSMSAAEVATLRKLAAKMRARAGPEVG